MSRKTRVLRAVQPHIQAKQDAKVAAEKPQFAIKFAWPTAIIECLCGAGNMMVIVGDNAPVACPACGVKRKIQADWSMNIVPA